jgi:folate-binding protein YgfZ
MNSEWQTFLLSQGANIATDGRIDFPAAAPGECELFDLSHLGLIAVRGEDAESFLQGQLTNDLRELTEQHSHLSSHCSAKGRMIANFRLFRRAGVIYLQLPAENLEPMLKRLGMFKLRAKVELEDASDRLVRIGLAGNCATEILEGEAGTPPSLGNGVTHHGELTLVRLPEPDVRYEILGPAERIVDLWTRLADRGAVPSGAERWALYDIRAGLPTVFGATVEAFVPQMANMQFVDGVSFTKGCYSGQEVVARMQYLGTLKRRMYRAEVDSPVAPKPGDELFADTSSSGQGAGKVVDARPTGDGRYELLAVLEISTAEQGNVCLGADGPRLRLLDLPYPISEPENRAH